MVKSQYFQLMLSVRFALCYMIQNNNALNMSAYQFYLPLTQRLVEHSH